MTREKARKILQKLATNSLCVEDYSNDKIKISSRMGAQALHSVSRERVERMRGEWIRGGYACGEHEWECSKCHGTEWRTTCSRLKFCPFCGAPMTDKAVEIVMERWEALKDGKGD